MGEDAVSYGRETFAFVENLNRLSTTEEVMDGLEYALAQFGFEMFVLHGVSDPKQRFEDSVVGRNWPINWCRLYAEERYDQDDPLAHLLKRAVEPFEWSENLYRAAQTPRAVEIVRRRRYFGIERGFMVSIHSAPSGTGFVHMSGRRFEVEEHSYPAIHLMTLYAFDRVCELCAPRAQETPLLTAREREVLTWVASGKTAWEIGEILAIAKRTVDEHAQRAFRKLGAVNRTHAVAIALRDHLIDL